MRIKIIQCVVSLLLIHLSACKKFSEVDPPVTITTGETVFENDATAIAVLTDIYANISQMNIDFANDGLTSITLYAGLSSDELALYNLNNTNYLSYYQNDLNSSTLPNLWYTLYPIIFIANSAIEGLETSDALTPQVKRQLLGEAKFIRAFCYFYLVGLFNDIPLVSSTDYKVNSSLPRASKETIYKQVINDLKDAQTQLSENYLDGTLQGVSEDRVRPTKWAATALLARVYLFVGDWRNAEIESTSVLENKGLFELISLNDVFLMNSNEAIWQLQPVGSEFDANTGEGKFFILPDGGPDDFEHPVYLNPNVIGAFENGDLRKENWTGNVIVGNNTYYFPFKYKVGSVNTTTQEYIMVFRLAEQYLIRAEARAYQNNLGSSLADINTIRSRAGLSNLSASTQPEILNAIQHERKVELFTEWGHRWFDLKRTGKIDAVMTVEASKKGGSWQTADQLYPIPQTELNANPNLVQNPGY